MKFHEIFCKVSLDKFERLSKKKVKEIWLRVFSGACYLWRQMLKIISICFINSKKKASSSRWFKFDFIIINEGSPISPLPTLLLNSNTADFCSICIDLPNYQHAHSYQPT